MHKILTTPNHDRKSHIVGLKDFGIIDFKDLSIAHELRGLSVEDRGGCTSSITFSS